MERKDWLEARAKNINSTEIAALFGCSPYLTKFQLWHQKKNGELVEIETNERMKWGTRLQDSIAAGIAEDQGWYDLQRFNDYRRYPELRIGASFDFKVYTQPTEFIDVREECILEIKNVDYIAFKNGWLLHDDGELEAPPHIELQVQHQLLVSGLSTAYIGALVGGNDVKLIKREADSEIQTAIKSKVKEFWQSISDNKQPDPDFTQDAEFISKLYGYAEPGKFRQSTDQIDLLAHNYRAAMQEEKIASENKSRCKAQLLMAIEDAEKVIGEDFTISAGVVGPKMIEAHERSGYRAFRVTFKKT